MNSDGLTELAALHALGVLEGDDAQAVRDLLKSGNPSLDADLAAFQEVAEALAKTLPIQRPSATVKEKLMLEIEARQRADPRLGALKQLLPPLSGGFAFVHEVQAAGWHKLPVPGAYFKLLSLDPQRQFAVGLGKLDPGAHYLSHKHFGPEDIYMLSGDLHIGDKVLHAGDYHHAAAGSTHPENFTEHGCTLLIVLSTQDLLTEIGRG
jgi:quercetin dioxygenase-like cupin family protein